MRIVPLAAAPLLIAPALVHGHSETEHRNSIIASPVSIDEKAFGREGDSKHVNRAMTVDMCDTMRFKPADITVKQGETTRFIVANKGKIMHQRCSGHWMR